MATATTQEITELLKAWGKGDKVALDALAAHSERRSRVVELRFFGGLSIEETAGMLKVSPETVSRDWNLARAWLYRDRRESDIMLVENFS